MRTFLLGLVIATSLAAAPVAAATVTLTKNLLHGTSDWTPYHTITDDTISMYGSEIFEGQAETTLPLASAYRSALAAHL